MPSSPLSGVIQNLLADVGPGGAGTDGELLARFLRSRDHDALAALVRRHAAMVWGVCRRLLHHHEAEDAFQATFLVLVRKAADVPREMVANWLYGVARQTAVRVRATAAKRRRREAQVATMPEPEDRGQETGDRRQESADLQSVVDEELGRLPDHYRSAVVLCELEGLTRSEAARQLGIPEGSVASRLARARAMLARRLARRGVAIAGGLVAAALSAGPGSAAACAPPALVASTIEAAGLLAAGRAANVPPRVADLTEGVVKAMLVTKCKIAMALLLAVTLLGAGVGTAFLTHRAQAGEPPKGQQPPVTAAESAQTPRPAGKDQTLTLEEPVQSMRWSRDGRVMASLSTRETEVDGKKVTLSTFRVWDGRTGKLKLNHGEVEYPGFGTFDLSPDGKLLAISSRRGIEVGDKVELYDAENGTLLTTVEMDYGRSRPWFAFSPDGRTLAVCGFEFKEGKAVGTVRLFDTTKGELKQKLFSHGGQVISVSFSPDGKSVAAGCAGGEITVWDTATGKIKTKLDAAGPISGLAWSADGKRLAAGGTEGGRVYDLAAGQSCELKAPDGEWRVNDLAFSPDGRHVAGDGGLVKKDDAWVTRVLVWDAATGNLRHEWLGLRGFAFTPDSKRLAILQDPKTVKLMALGQEQPAPKGGQNMVPAKTDRERMVGEWVVMNTDDQRRGQRWVITEDYILMNYYGPGLLARQYHVLDADKDPKRIDISFTQGNGPPAIKGIYALDGDELRLCLGAPGKDRPAAFPEKPRPGEVLVLRRQLPDGGQPKAKDKEPFTAWGQESGGLQAGLGFRPGEHRAYRPGETVTLVVRVRNVGKEGVSFQYLRHFFIEHPPAVVGDTGKAVALTDGTPRGIYRPEDVTLAPGKGIELYELVLALGEKRTDTPKDSTLYGEGKFQLQYERVLGESLLSSVPIKCDPALRKLATGKLDLVVKNAKDAETKPAPAGPKQPVETDEEGILGHWIIVNDDSKRKGEPWQINKDKLYMHANIAGFYGGHFYRLDAGKTPKQIDIFHRQGGDPKGAAVNVIKGIYVLDTNELRLCLGEEGKDRPAAFPEKPKPGEVLILHRTPPRPSPTKEERLKALTDKVLEAHGGEEKLNKLQFSMTVKHSNNETQHYFVRPPKDYRWETTHPDRTGKRICILLPYGRQFWTKEPNEEPKPIVYTGVELPMEFWLDHVKFFGPRQVLRLKDPDHKVTLLDEVKVGDRAAVGVEVTLKVPNKQFTPSVKMYFDTQTHLLAKLEGNVAFRQPVLYSDYKTFDGIPVARKEKDGYFDGEVIDFKVVDKFPDKLFEKP